MKNKEIDIKRGQRLQMARKAAGLTQQELADKAGFAHYNSISMYETGTRSIDWDNAKLFAKALNVNADYLMGETDVMSGVVLWDILDADSVGVSDRLFLAFLQSQGYDISFNCIFPHEVHNQIIAEKVFIDFSDMPRHTITLESIDFSLSSIKAIIENETGKHEAIIESVNVNGHKIPYGVFAQFIDRLYDHVQLDMDRIREYTQSMDYHAYYVMDEVMGRTRDTADLHGLDVPAEYLAHAREAAEETAHQLAAGNQAQN